MTQSFDAPAVVGTWRRGWLAILMAASLLALLTTAAAPAINLNSSLALAAWAVSATGGFVGTPVVLVLGVAWLSCTGRFAGRRRSTALALLAAYVEEVRVGYDRWAKAEVVDLPDGRRAGELCFGEQVLLPLGDGETAQMSLRPGRRWDVGAGPGQAVNVAQHGGAVGLVLDGRGRPIEFAPDDLRGQVAAWQGELHLYGEQ